MSLVNIEPSLNKLYYLLKSAFAFFKDIMFIDNLLTSFRADKSRDYRL